MRSVLAIVVAVALIMVGYFLFLHPVSYTNYPLRQGPVVAFGYSLIQGVGSTEGKDFVSLLSKKIGEPVENFGVSGDTTRDSLARLGEAVTRHPRIAIILLGGNDYLKRVPEKETFDNLRKIIEAFQEDGALVVVLGVRGGLLADNDAGDFKTLA